MNRQTKRMTALALLNANCLKRGDFVLSSGQPSSVHVDCGMLQSHPSELNEVSLALMRGSYGRDFDRYAAIASGGVIITVPLSLRTGIGMITIPKVAKDHGPCERLEGDYGGGMRVCLVDDVLTSGLSVELAIKQLESEYLVVDSVWEIVDRQSRGLEKLVAAGYQVKAIITLSELMDVALGEGKVDREFYDLVMSEIKQQ